MTIDHSAINAWMDMVGNVAMPIYTYRQVGRDEYESMYIMAMITEWVHYLALGTWGNILWLFVGVAMTRDRGTGIKILGGMIITVLVTIKPYYCIWIPCLMTRERSVWYGIHSIAALLNPTILIHLLGYEIARWDYKRRWKYKINGILYYTYYPVHLGLIGLMKYTM